MAEFVGLDPYAAQRGVQMIEAANLTRAQAAQAAADTEARRLDTTMKGDAFKRTQDFMAKVAQGETVNTPAMVPGVDGPTGVAAVEPGSRPSLEPLKSAVPEWQKQLDEADKQSQLARDARKAGLPDDKYVDNARLARESGMKGKLDAEAAQIKGLEQGLAQLDMIDGPEMAQRVLSQMERARPGMPEQLGFQKGMDGKFVWDDNAVQQLGMFKQQLAGTLEERKFVAEQERLAETKRENDRRERKDEQLAQYRDQLAAARSAKDDVAAQLIQARIKDLEGKGERLDNKLVTRRTEIVQGRLDKDVAYKVFPKYEQAFQQQAAIRDAIADDKTYRNINAPQIDTLAKAFNAMAGQFRQQRAGTKFEAQNVAKFNGFMQNTEKWLATIGEGTPAVNRTTALQISDAMTDMYAIAAGEALKAELEAQTAKGIAPELLQLRVVNDNDTLALLIKKGHMTMFDTDGKVIPLGSKIVPAKVKIFGNTYDAPKR